MAKIENQEVLDIDKFMESIKQRINIAVIYSANPDLPQNVMQRTFNYRTWFEYKLVAHDIANTLKTLGYENVYVLTDGLQMLRTLEQLQIDLVWLNTGGVQGQDSICHAACILESVGLPYIGQLPRCYVFTENKLDAKEKMQFHGINTPPYVFFDIDEPFDMAKLHSLKPPFILKPRTGAQSRHIEYVEYPDLVGAMVETIRNKCNLGVLVEEYIEGTELTVPVMGKFYFDNNAWQEHDKPLVLPVLERLGKSGKVFPTLADISLKNRAKPYNGPAKRTLEEIAKKVYRVLNCRSIVRVDLILGQDGIPYVLEVNPKPDFTAPNEQNDSFVNIAARAYGFEYNFLIKTVLYDRIYQIFKYEKSGSRLLQIYSHR